MQIRVRTEKLYFTACEGPLQHGLMLTHLITAYIKCAFTYNTLYHWPHVVYHGKHVWIDATLRDKTKLITLSLQRAATDSLLPRQ